MKKFNLFKMLAVLIVLITSINTAWGYYYLNGSTNLTGNNWDWYNASCSMGVSNTITFMAKAADTYYFKLYKYVDNNNKWNEPCGSIHSLSDVGGVVDSYGQQEGTCAAMWITTNEVSNITFTLSGSDQLDITVTKCAYYIKYAWWGDNGDVWSGALADCNDGTNYFTMGRFNSTVSQFWYGRKNSDGGADCNTAGGSDAGNVTYYTTKGSPSNNTKCYFIYNPTNHTLDIRAPHVVTQPNYIYFDNSQAQWDDEEKIYFIIGHSDNTPWQNVHLTAKVDHTKLRYALNSSSWTDAGYCAMILNSGGWGGGSGVSYTSLKNADKYSAVNWDYYPMAANHHYIVNMASGANGSPISLTDKDNATSNLNTTQTIKYSISRDGGTTYAEQTSGVTPAQITISAYKFVDGTYATVTNAGNEQSVSVNQSSKYSTTVDAAYTGETSLSYSSKRDGYTFIGWYTTADGNSTRSTTYNPKDETTTYARFRAHRYTIAFNKNDAQYPGTTSSGSTTGISNVVYDQNVTLTANGFEREGYTFAGWNREADGSGASYTDEQSVINLTATDGATVTLYAQWTETTHTVGVVYKYGETSIHDAGSVAGVGIVTTQDATAIDITGYDFTTWSAMPGGVTKVSGDLDDETITINATADDKTITANYTPHVYNGTVDKTTGTTDGTYSVTFKTTSLSASGMAKAGYYVDGYYLSYSAGVYDVYVADKDGNLQPSKSIGDDRYTNSSSQWIYDGNPTIYAHWAENTYTITLYRNDGTSTSTISEVTMGHNDYDPSIDVLERAGYSFDGFFTEPSGGTKVINADGTKPTTSYIDKDANWIYPGDVDLYAHWTPVALSFVGGEGESGKAWNTASNWSPACVPTSGHDVTINAETTINGSAVAKSVTIGSSGKVTIQPTGVLEVAGTVTNTDADKLIINTDDSNQGALICDNSAGSTQATVNLTTQYANGKFQFIAIPLYGVSVASTFSGKGKYTYGWKYGEGWERRGYYDAFTAFEAVLLMGQTYTSFAGALVSTNVFSASLSYDASKVSGDVYMYGNSWTAPIRRSDMTLSGISSINILNGSSNGWDGVVSGDVIPALQGYAAVVSSSGGSISIDYDDAVRNAATPNASLRAPKRNVSDPIAVYVTGNEMQTRIRLFEDEQFTDELDEGYEALYMEGNGYAGELYAMDAKKMNVLATSDLEGTVVGFVPGQATEYTISFAGEGKGYYLNDIEAQESTLISEENTYTFLSGTNDAARFIVSRTPISKTTTGTDVIYDGVKARKQMINGTLYIIRDGRMYDATGALVK